MSAPDYNKAQANARAEQRARFAPGTRVEHEYQRGRYGTIVKLHVGTLKRQKSLARWTATVDWDGGKPAIHVLDLLHVV